MSESAVQLERTSGAGFLNLRGSAAGKDFLATVQQVTGVLLPVKANTVNGDETRGFWLGPDEWLLQCDADACEKLHGELETALQDEHAAVNNLSGGMVAYQLSGPRSRDLLATGSTLDLHPQEFGPGCCAQTRLAKATVVLSVEEDSDRIQIVVRRSFADYLWRWLVRAGREFRIEVA